MVAHWVDSKHLFKAVLCLCEVLASEIDVAEFKPGLFVDLVNLEILIKHRYGIVMEVIVLIQGDKSLHCLPILWSLLQDLKVELLGFERVVLRFIKHSKEPHSLDVIWKEMANCLHKHLRPFLLLQLERGQKEFFSKRCKSDIIKNTCMIFSNIDSDLQDDFRVLALLVVSKILHEQLASGETMP